MKKNLVLLLLLLSSILLANLAPYYHDLDEIESELMELQAQNPDIVKVEQIGVTFGAPYQEPLHVWAVKISDNVNVEEDEPKVLYSGQVHAEEVLGVEITMAMIHEIIEHRNQPPYSYWISELETWFVPTYNPEGLLVILDTDEDTWRKNQRDNNGNGVLDVYPGSGRDIDGVDLNRNYSFNWVHGDTLYSTNGEEEFDYYRGPSPISEGGIQAMVDLSAENHFIYSIAWHSSRTGNLSEKVFYSFEWNDLKFSPDFAHNEYIGQEVASRIQNETGSAFYEPSPSRGRKGSAHEWHYKEYGTTQLLIECCTSNLQPEEDLMLDTIERCKPGAYWLMNRILGYQTDAAMLTGHVTDAATGSPIVAEIIIEENHASFFTPRLSDETYGRYWRQLNPATYTLRIRKEGYVDHIETVIVNNSSWTIREVALQPIEAISISGAITSGATALSGEIEIRGEYPRTIDFTNGTYQIDSFVGDQSFIVKVDGFVPAIYTQILSADTIMDFILDTEIVLMTESFENGLTNWTAEDSWATEMDPASDTYAMVLQQDFFENDYNNFYDNNMNASVEYNNFISLQGVDDDVALIFDHKYYVEHDTDYCFVEVSNNGSNWTTLRDFTGINKAWSDVKNPTNENVVISLADYVDTYLYLRFRFTSDETQNDPGWWIDNLKIVSSVGAGVDDDEVPGIQTKLFNNYPNPFNPETTISFSIGNSENITNLKIYNVKGQLVKSLINEKLTTGTHNIVWNGKDNSNRSVASGVYFYKLVNDNFVDSKKMILLK